VPQVVAEMLCTPLRECQSDPSMRSCVSSYRCLPLPMDKCDPVLEPGANVWCTSGRRR
jgi:hypothetical protein